MYVSCYVDSLETECYVFYFELSSIWKVYIKEKLFPGYKNYLHKHLPYSKKHSFADILQNRFSLKFAEIQKKFCEIFKSTLFIEHLRWLFVYSLLFLLCCVPTLLPYRNQSINLDCKPIYWFLHAVNIGR